MLNNPECVIKYIVTYMAIMITIFIAWIIYGYMLYFGDDNNCQENPHTAGWLVFMIILLFIGIIVIILVLIAACLLCCVCCMMKSQEAEAGEKKLGILDRIPQMKMLYDPDKFKNVNTCAICLEKFDSDPSKDFT